MNRDNREVASFMEPHSASSARSPRFTLLVLALVAVAFALSHPGYTGWDSEDQLRYSYMIGARFFGLASQGEPITWFDVQWYGPFFEAILAFFTRLFDSVLQNTLWLRSALNLLLFLLSGVWVYRLLVRFGFSGVVSAFAALSVYGTIRLGGHALHNTKDAPLAIAVVLCTLLLYEFRNSRRVFAIALIPALIRLPMIFHLVTAVFVARALARRKWTEIFALTGICALALMAATPGTYDSGPLAWIQAVLGFSRWHWSGDVRFFGQMMNNAQLPFYYSLIWIPVSLSPAIFIVFCASIARIIALCFEERRLFTSSIALSRHRGFFQVLWLLTALLLASVLLIQPKVFDEERHLLFLVTELAFSCVLTGVYLMRDFFTRYAKPLLALTAALILADYAQWGQFSYVYKSRLIGDRSSERFMGDYTGVCVGDAIRKITQYFPQARNIGIQGPLSSARIQLDQLKRENENARAMRVDWANFERDDFIISINRIHTQNGVREMLSKGMLKEAFRITMPPGDAACVVTTRR